MTSISARGFEGQLTMAPEVRDGSSCTYSSDMFSFGGLVFFAMFRSYCLLYADSPLPSCAGSVDIPSDCNDEELRSLLKSLLARDASKRLSASLAMSHPFFSAAGSKAREEAFARLRQIEIQQQEMVW